MLLGVSLASRCLIKIVVTQNKRFAIADQFTDALAVAFNTPKENLEPYVISPLNDDPVHIFTNQDADHLSKT
jgi:hypothetical protein